MELLNNFQSNGFAKISGVFSTDEIKKLRRECFNILDCKKNVQYPELPPTIIINPLVENYKNDASVTNFINQKLRNCIGVSQEIDNLLVKFFQNSEVNEILNYFFVRPKIDSCFIRYADDKSSWLGIHSDGDTSISMSILLNDTYDTDTTTSFIKGSHLYNNPLKNKIERLNPRIFSNLLDYSTGIAGDVNIFFNKTGHGVVKRKENNAAIIIGFHCDQDLINRNLILDKTTLYGKDTALLDSKILKFFDTDPNERKFRNKDVKKVSKIDNIKNYRKLKLKEFAIYYYLKIFEYFIKTVRVLIK